jgi:hypothetical protein
MVALCKPFVNREFEDLAFMGVREPNLLFSSFKRTPARFKTAATRWNQTWNQRGDLRAFVTRSDGKPR